MCESSDTVYTDVTRKCDLVERLQSTLDGHMHAAEILDKKAWDILSVTGATLGLAITIQLTVRNEAIRWHFWVALTIVLILYLLQIRAILSVVRPASWRLVPGGPEGKISFEILRDKYVAVDESTYLDKLIVDYVGKNDPEKEGDILLGAIQVAIENNENKAKHIQKAAWLLGAIVMGLIGLAIVSTLG